MFGRFVPDFGRVNAQMQFDMYHHYTVDEHTIRAIGLLARNRKGRAEGGPPAGDRDHASNCKPPRALCRDAAARHRQGARRRSFGVLGAEVAEKLCPRLGLNAAETETVAWLVRHHLLMSGYRVQARSGRLEDDHRLCPSVQSPERLRLLLVLTIVDIRAVGPGVWNSWKRQLLSELYEAAEERAAAGP